MRRRRDDLRVVSVESHSFHRRLSSCLPSASYLHHGIRLLRRLQESGTLTIGSGSVNHHFRWSTSLHRLTVDIRRIPKSSDLVLFLRDGDRSLKVILLCEEWDHVLLRSQLPNPKHRFCPFFQITRP